MGQIGSSSAGFDAGIHLGESIQRDMVAVRVSRDQRLAVVGSPAYFASHLKPGSPHDLPNHPCINLRGGSARPFRWEFEKDGEALAVDVSGRRSSGGRYREARHSNTAATAACS